LWLGDAVVRDDVDLAIDLHDVEREGTVVVLLDRGDLVNRDLLTLHKTSALRVLRSGELINHLGLGEGDIGLLDDIVGGACLGVANGIDLFLLAVVVAFADDL